MIRTLLCVFLICVSVAAQPFTKLPTFRVPHKPWIMFYDLRSDLPASANSLTGFMQQLEKEKSQWSCNDHPCLYTAFPFQWGQFGTAVMVWESNDKCGKSNCDFQLFYRNNGAWQVDNTFGGQGFMVVPNGTAIPDLADAGLQGGTVSIMNLYRYREGKFARIACDDDEGDGTPIRRC